MISEFEMMLELNKKISLRVNELIEKVEKKRWDEETLLTFHVGLSGDIEEAITLTQEKIIKLFEEEIEKFPFEDYYVEFEGGEMIKLKKELKSKIIGEKWKQPKKKI